MCGSRAKASYIAASRASIEENYAKQLAKLHKKINSTKTDKEHLG